MQQVLLLASLRVLQVLMSLVLLVYLVLLDSIVYPVQLPVQRLALLAP